MKTFYSHGKLLLTAEYVVLDGAKALAIPTTFGQSLKVMPIDERKISWKSIDFNGNHWFQYEISFKDIASNSPQPSNAITLRLFQIINAAKKLNPDFLNESNGFEVITELEFNRNWGLGTSSTLINNIADWAGVDAYELLELTFGGSGYDIACARHESSILYQLNNNSRSIQTVSFKPEFANNLFFIYLNIKQDSRKGIDTYNKEKRNISNSISKINSITNQIINCQDLYEFESLLSEHEQIISSIVKLKPIKDVLFLDYNGAIKSLGAWGGDFILATETLDDMDYFKNKGYNTIVKFNDMVL